MSISKPSTYCKIFIIVFIVFQSSSVQAQVQVNKNDRNTRVSSNGSRITVSGGRRKGDFILHKFKELNINRRQELYFDQSKLSTIINKVTGRNPSIINGNIKSRNRANVIIINSNGITFGGLTNIDIGGDFIATTSDSFELEDDRFTANFIDNSSAITIKGVGHNRIIPGFDRQNIILEASRSANITNTSTKSVSLIAGRITISGGILDFDNSKVNLSSIQNGSFTFPDLSSVISEYASSRHEISFSERAFLNSIDGSISLTADSLRVDDSSLIRHENVNGVLGHSIDIDAPDIRLTGTTSSLPPLPFTFLYDRGIRSQTNEFNGADINVKTTGLDLAKQSSIVSFTTGKGDAGDINISAEGNIFLDGPISPDTTVPFGSFILSYSFDEGRTGAISIRSKDLLLENGGNIQTVVFGSGDSKPLRVDVSNNLILRGSAPISNTPSLISGVTVGRIDGNPSGNGGSVSISAKNIELSDGGSIDVSTFGSGNSGEVSIAADSISISGSIPNDRASQISSSSAILNPFLSNQFELSIPTGNAGDINIDADVINVFDNGSISVGAEGTGNAGIISLKASEIKLSSLGNISASTNGGAGGNISIESGQLRLDNASLISNALGNGIGGDIDISTKLLALNNGSRIQANAENAQAGTVRLVSDIFLADEDSIVETTSARGPQFDGSVIVEFQDSQLEAPGEIAPVQRNIISVADACSSGKNSLTVSNRKLEKMTIDEPELISAADLKRRLEIARQYKFRDENGQVHQFKRWLGVEKLPNGMGRFIYEPTQNKAIQEKLASLERFCAGIKS